MACNKKTNTMEHLTNMGLINEMGSVLDMPGIKRELAKMQELVRNKYGIKDNPFSIQDNQVVLNDSFFDKITSLEGVSLKPKTDNKYSSYIQHKLEIIEGLKERVQALKFQKGKPGVRETIGKAKNLITKLEQEVENISQASSWKNIISMVGNDISFYKKMLEEGDLSNRQEIIQNIKYFESIINERRPFNPIDNTGNPLFGSLMDNNGSIALPDEYVHDFEKQLVEPLQQLVASFDTYSNNLFRQSVMDNRSVQKRYSEEISEDFEKFIKEKFIQDLEDISVVENVLGVGLNAFGKDSLIPQLEKDEVARAHLKHQGIKNRYIKEVARTFNLAKEELPSDFGKIDTSVFIKKTKSGVLTGELVGKYSSKWGSQQRLIDNFDKQILATRYNSNLESASKSVKIEGLKASKLNAIRNSSNVLDITRLKGFKDVYGVAEDSEYFTYTDEEMAEYEAGLKEVLGRDYESQIKAAEEELKNFIDFRNERLVQGEEYDSQINQLNNPLAFLSTYGRNNDNNIDYTFTNKAGTKTKAKESSDMRNIILIPKRDIAFIDESGEIDSKDSGYYDKDFEFISESENLYNYYTALSNSVAYHNESFNNPGVDTTSYAKLKRSLYEILLDAQEIPGLWDRIKASWLAMRDYLSESVSQRGESVLSEDKVGINKRYNDDSKFQISEESKLLLGNFLYKDGNQFKVKDELSSFIGDNLGLEAKNRYDSLDKKAGSFSLEVQGYIDEIATKNVMSQYSTDLNKVTASLLEIASSYNARREVQPKIKALQDIYTGIKRVSKNYNDPSLDQDRLIRTNANAKNKYWYARAVLGNNTTTTFGKLSGSLGIDKLSDNGKLVAISKMLDKNKTYTSRERYLKDLIKDDVTLTEEEKTNRIEELGAVRTLSGFVDAVLTGIIFKSLGFNPVSGFRNRMEGKFTNYIADGLGQYWSAGNIVPVNSFMTKSLIPGESKEQYKLMEAFINTTSIMQDTSNELQKSNIHSNAKINNKWFDPFTYSVGIPEMRNQGEVVLCKLMDETMEQTLEDGSIVNVPVFDGSKFTGLELVDGAIRLKEGFNTPSNTETFIDLTSDKWADFQVDTVTTISLLAGNYDIQDALLAKRSTVGKIAFTFKTFLPTKLYQHFATSENDILNTGQKGFKGQQLYQTNSTAAITWGTTGFLLGGPLGAGIGLASGLGWGFLMGLKSDVSALNQIVGFTRGILIEKLNMPLRLVGSTKLIEDSKFKETFEGMTEVELQNVQANIKNMANILSLVLLKLIIKGLFWDDDDDKDGIKRATHNVLENEVTSLIDNGQQFLVPGKLWDSATNIAMVKYVQNVGKFVEALSDNIGGHGYYTNGPLAGRNKSVHYGKKLFMPNFINYTPLTEIPSSKKDYNPGEYLDRLFSNEETQAKREATQLRTQLKNEMLGTYKDKYSGETLDKFIEKRLRPYNKKKKESYEDVVKRLERALN